MLPELHETSLIELLAIGFVLALLLGMLASALRISPIVGYLLAGIAVGPFTPGFVADSALTAQLAEIGVILLMFGVGLHFSIKDLLSVRYIALPGAIAQIVTATAIGAVMAHVLGWSLGAGIVFGLSLSVASTVVLLRALEERNAVQSSEGKIAVGWLIVEDLAMVLTLVLLPALAPVLKEGADGSFDSMTLMESTAITLTKVAAFIAIMLVVGKRVIPWILHYVAHTGSRELFRLSVLAIALGVAFGAALLFDVSLALGAFFAGMILSESELSQRAASETLPLRDAFAVLFLVSVGMLVDPMIVFREPISLLATVLIIVIGKSLAAFLIVRSFGHPMSTALTISASLAQIGEFSFILAGLGVALMILPERGRELILAGAILSILLNPLVFAAVDRRLMKAEAKSVSQAGAAGEKRAFAREPIPVTKLVDHVVLVGYGRVGSMIGATLPPGTPLLVIEDDADRVAALKGEGREAIVGNAAHPDVIGAANFRAARCLLVAIPDAFEGGQVTEQARALNPSLWIIARAHSKEEIEHLKKHGATSVVMGEHEIARAMVAGIPPRES
jgi:CPA2 family monovalent cation:H+ antiporter-2